jgi:hypothetical protein
MRPRDLLRRELRIVLGARVTWMVLAASALLVGHSFVLALDLYSAASQSAMGFGLMQSKIDPLGGIVRPMLGGLHLCTALLVPVIATRGLAIEKERRSYGALALAVGGTRPVVLAKGLAALAGSALLLVPLLVLLALFAALGGHLDAIETGIAVGGHALHLIAFTAVAVAAGAASRTVAQATTLAVAVSLTSWAIDAGEGFAALAWLGRLEWASVSQQLARFELGVVPAGGIAWFVGLAAAAFGAALLFARIEAPMHRWGSALVVIAVGVLSLRLADTVPHAYDWSEQRRVSLPPEVVEGLREIDDSIRIEIHLDRDDGTRRQLQHSVIDRLRLARPDLVVETPLDDRSRVGSGEHDDDYGQILIHVGDAVRHTRTTSRKELVTLVFEAAGRPLPNWQQPPYAGYPTVVEGGRRTIATSIAYGVLPLSCLLLGAVVTRIRRRGR